VAVRVLGITGICVLAAGGLSACNGGSSAAQTSDGSFNQTIKGEGGSESSVRFGKDAHIPKDFPSEVPLPTAGTLRSVVSEKNPPNAAFTMTYLTGNSDGIDIGNSYRDRLTRAGFKIKNYSSVGGSDGGITQFDAIGKKWDVAVVSGKASPRDRSTLSVQVHTHGQITSGIGGIGDTTPDATAPAGSGIEVPNPDVTTTTTSGF
jgi:hypothetical protein